MNDALKEGGTLESYYIRWRGRISGPLSSETITEQMRDGRLSKHHQISSDRQRWESLQRSSAFSHLCGANTAQETVSPPEAIDDGKKAGLRLKDDRDAAESALWQDGDDMRSFYYVEDGEVTGPVSLYELRSMLNAGQVTEETPVCAEGSQDWIQARDVVGQEPPPGATQAPTSAQAASDPSDHRICLSCGRMSVAVAPFCQFCGKSFGVRSESDEVPLPAGLITFTWIMFVCDIVPWQFVIGLSSGLSEDGIIFGWIIEAIFVVLVIVGAVRLCNSKNSAAKTNGTIIVSIWLINFVVWVLILSAFT